MSIRWFSLIVCLVFAATTYAARVELNIAPTATDSDITTDLEDHYVAIDDSLSPKNYLFVFFPGTFATPSNYKMVTNAAADMGFHAIDLNYPNSVPVNLLCGMGMTDLDCYGNVRREILFGNDESPLLDVNRANSAENRLIKLLQYLVANRPDDNWEQYLTPENEPKWERIIVAGHSQGGGHAGILGRYKPVARSIMYAAMDFNGTLVEPATWISDPDSTPNATPPERFFAFSTCSGSGCKHYQAS